MLFRQKSFLILKVRVIGEGLERVECKSAQNDVFMNAAIASGLDAKDAVTIAESIYCLQPGVFAAGFSPR